VNLIEKIITMKHCQTNANTVDVSNIICSRILVSLLVALGFMRAVNLSFSKVTAPILVMLNLTDTLHTNYFD
jgi:hypothetical protein